VGRHIDDDRTADKRNACDASSVGQCLMSWALWRLRIPFARRLRGGRPWIQRQLGQHGELRATRFCLLKTCPKPRRTLGVKEDIADQRDNHFFL
jgi:hypothetical protein